MTLTEAREILGRRPEWVREARCDNVEHWIRVYLDTARHGIVHPGQDPLAVAKEILHDLNRQASAAGDEPYPLTLEELAAYLVVNTAEQAERARAQRAANAPVGQYKAAYQKAYDEQNPALTVAQAAKLLGTSPRTVQRAITEGRLRAFRPGKHGYRIRRSALEEFERASQVLSPDELLTLPWADLTAAQRDEALALARKRGTEEAAADRGAAGGIDQPTADAHTYCRRVVERAFQDGHCPEALLQRWWREFKIDPRIHAFCDAWAVDMAEAAEQLAKVEAEVAEGIRHEKETRKRGPDA